MPQNEDERPVRVLRARKPRAGPFASKPKHPDVLQRAWQALEERRRRRAVKPARGR